MAENVRRRHDFVWVDESAWALALAAQPDIAALPWVADWAANGWPLIVRRRSESDPMSQVALGLPLPPSAGKRRLCFFVPAHAVGSGKPPPLLSAAAKWAPAHWRETLGALIALDPEVRVFGALAWTMLTGLTYLSSTSDIDLLWSMRPAIEAAALVRAIAAIEADAPVRLDGELVRPDGAAANWRELAGASGEVLVKRLDGVSVQSREAFLETDA